jgi:hypothetical protein
VPARHKGSNTGATVVAPGMIAARHTQARQIPSDSQPAIVEETFCDARAPDVGTVPVLSPAIPRSIPGNSASGVWPIGVGVAPLLKSLSAALKSGPPFSRLGRAGGYVVDLDVPRPYAASPTNKDISVCHSRFAVATWESWDEDARSSSCTFVNSSRASP